MPTITKRSAQEVTRILSDILADKRSQEATREFNLVRADID